MKLISLLLLLFCLANANDFTKSIEKLGYTEVVPLETIPADLQGSIVMTVLIEPDKEPVMVKDGKKTGKKIGEFDSKDIMFLEEFYDTILVASGFKPNGGNPLRYTFIRTYDHLFFITPVRDLEWQPFGRYICQVYFLKTDKSFKFFFK